MKSFAFTHFSRFSFLFAIYFATPLFSPGAQAACLPGANSDYLTALLNRLPQCPKNVFEFRDVLQRDGMQLRTTMVANRGFHNPTQGSFSLFEMALGASESTRIPVKQGEFFFGHFTAPQGNQLVADQTPNPGALMIELIAWDLRKQVFNFYELIGDGKQGRWFYRGNSRDIQRDVQLLHLQPNPAQPKFGQTLRCSGCHTGGGPIMKELAFPHNDWWDTSRRLPTGGRTPDPALAGILANLVPAKELSSAVQVGILKLQPANSQAPLSLREKLRPLFCPMEINLESSPQALSVSQEVRIPSAFFSDPRLGSQAVTVSKTSYLVGMSSLGMRFPETGAADADHAFLTPSKAYSDMAAVESLRRSGLIDDELITDILAIDFTNPIFSQARCGLLRWVPERANGNWKQEFAKNLQGALAQSAGSPWQPVLRMALANLTDPVRTAQFHRKKTQEFLNRCRDRATTSIGAWVRLLAQRRNEVRASEISKNPKGQILEPGFRVIFPEPAQPQMPGKLWLDESCQVKGSE